MKFYEQAIEELSQAYNQGGRSKFEEKFSFLEEKYLEGNNLNIVRDVLDDYLARERPLGAFPKFTIKELVQECKNRDLKLNKSPHSTF